MELQWPLILFTTLVAWSAGLFGTQALLAAGGHAKKSQTPAWVASAVLLAAGGIAVFFHLEHWERIFNGFGHLTSGITQELIAIVVLAVVAVAYLVAMRRSDDGVTVPKWLCWLSVAVCVVLVAVVAHSYTMAARPAWDSVLWILYVLGNACALGPCTMALIMAAAGDETAPAGPRRDRPRGRGRPGAAPLGGRGPRRRRPPAGRRLHGQEVFQLEALGRRRRGLRPRGCGRAPRGVLRAGFERVHALLAPASLRGGPADAGRRGRPARGLPAGPPPTGPAASESWSQTAPYGTPEGRSGAPAGRAILATWGFSGREGRGGCETGPARAAGRGL